MCRRCFVLYYWWTCDSFTSYSQFRSYYIYAAALTEAEVENTLDKLHSAHHTVHCSLSVIFQNALNNNSPHCIVCIQLQFVWLPTVHKLCNAIRGIALHCAVARMSPFISPRFHSTLGCTFSSQIQTVFVAAFECICVFVQIVFVHLYIKNIYNFFQACHISSLLSFTRLWVAH